MKVEAVLKEYVRSLNDDDLSMLFAELTCNRLEEAAEHISMNKDLDRWFCSARDFEAWFEMIDLATDYVKREYKRRGDRVRSI